MVDFFAEFEASLKRLSEGERGEQFIDRFYERFMAADDEIAAQFNHTDLRRQKIMLRESLEEMKVFFCDHLQSPYLRSLARVHGPRGRNIPDAMYDIWLTTLIAAVRDTDPECNRSVELAWRVVMAPGIEFMKHYGEDAGGV